MTGAVRHGAVRHGADRVGFAAVRARCDRGSASIAVLGAGLALLAIALGFCAVGLAVGMRHQAQSAADLAALAGAGRIGLGGDPCAAAGDVAARNGAVIAQCSVQLGPDGRSGRVEVQVRVVGRLGGIAQEASAWAAAERTPAL